jgi:hypothetical protein
MIGMAEVKGIIFADDGADAHGGGLLSGKKDEKRIKREKGDKKRHKIARRPFQKRQIAL